MTKLIEPPSNVDAEQATLAGLLQEPLAIARLNLRGEMFYRALHGDIFDAMVALVARDGGFDRFTVHAQLCEQGVARKIGGEEYLRNYLVELDAAVPSSFGIEDHARIVSWTWVQRETAIRARNLASVAQGGARSREALLLATADLQRLVESGFGAQGPAFAPIILNAGDVEPEEVAWLWPERLALGALSAIAGDPEVGKSTLTCALAATITQGAPWPDCKSPCPRGGVVMVCAEDNPSTTIVPRLKANGADLKRVNLFRGMKGRDLKSGRSVEKPMTLVDLRPLEMAIDQTDQCKAVFIDPLGAYLGGIDEWRNGEVRGLLEPLCELAARKHVAIIAVSHLNKNNTAARYRLSGSVAFLAAPRAVWGVAYDKNDPDRRVIGRLKNNLSGIQTGLAYRIRGGLVQWETEPVKISADELFAVARGDAEDRSDIDIAVDWLQKTLDLGKVETKCLQRLAQEAGHSWRTVQRAKSKIGARADREGFGVKGVWYWYLPAKERQLQGESTPPDADSNNLGALLGEGTGNTLKRL